MKGRSSIWLLVGSRPGVLDLSGVFDLLVTATAAGAAVLVGLLLLLLLLIPSTWLAVCGLL